jgi:hypothetical protein
MQQQHLIEQYLRGEMSAQQRTEFLNMVRNSPELASELAFQEQLFKALGDENKRRFTGQLEAIGVDFFKDTPLAMGTSSLPRWWFLPLLLLVAGAVWYFWPAAPNSAVSVISTPPPGSADPAIAVPSNDTAIVSAPTQAVTSTAKAETDDLKTNAAPAAIDKGPAFAPNAHWEKMSAQRLSGNSAKQIKATGKIKNSGEIGLSLQFKWPAGEKPGPMTVYFYNNSEADRLNNNPIKKIDLNLIEQSAGDGSSPSAYSLDYSAGVSWPPGLYYFVIVPSGSNEPIYVGRMRQ